MSLEGNEFFFYYKNTSGHVFKFYIIFSPLTLSENKHQL